jgi:hypothetical protein
MKIKKTVSPFILFVSVLVLVRQCHGQSNVVYYGTNASPINVAFADTSLSASAQASIVADLQVCLSEWGKETQFRLGADDPAFVAHLYNPDITPYYPETIDFPDNVVSNGAAGLALHIPKKLSDAYTNAFAFAAANSNIVAAAYEFVAFVSSSNFVAISSNDLPNYVLQKNTTTNEIIADAQETISELRCQTFYPPSILGFQYSAEGPAATNLWMLVPCSIPLRYMDEKGWNAFPAIWHDNKWKFCIWDSWVP